MPESLNVSAGRLMTALYDGLAAVELARLLVLLAHDVLTHVAFARVTEHAVGQDDEQPAAGLEQLQAAVDEQDRRIGAGRRSLFHMPLLSGLPPIARPATVGE